MFNLSEKGHGIRAMFDDIAPRYDLLNRILSFGIDRRWRRYAVGQLDIPPRGKVLDIATGTGDVALEIASRTPESVQIIGEDLTKGMLVHGQKKIAASPYAHRPIRITPLTGSLLLSGFVMWWNVKPGFGKCVVS
jgi:demethylmenaquinone methyltransferase/2-methoxy-6-polyprenyl-1,4-benzoquinol methylase